METIYTIILILAILIQLVAIFIIRDKDVVIMLLLVEILLFWITTFFTSVNK